MLTSLHLPGGVPLKKKYNGAHGMDFEYSRGTESTEGDHFTSVPPEPVVNRGNPIRERAGKRSRGLEEAGPSYSTVPADTPGLLLAMADTTRLPAHEFVTEFKCVEGWSQITHWSGVRMADFIEAYPPARKPDGSLPRYVYMETPNGDYDVGYDMAVCRHRRPCSSPGWQESR
jgi:hypothetical protein